MAKVVGYHSMVVLIFNLSRSVQCAYWSWNLLIIIIIMIMIIITLTNFQVSNVFRTVVLIEDTVNK